VAKVAKAANMARGNRLATLAGGSDSTIELGSGPAANRGSSSLQDRKTTQAASPLAVVTAGDMQTGQRRHRILPIPSKAQPATTTSAKRP